MLTLGGSHTWIVLILAILLFLLMQPSNHLFLSLRHVLYDSRYVIFPVQVLAKSCKPVPVMLMGALRGKKYPMQKVRCGGMWWVVGCCLEDDAHVVLHNKKCDEGRAYVALPHSAVLFFPFLAVSSLATNSNPTPPTLTQHNTT